MSIIKQPPPAPPPTRTVKDAPSGLAVSGPLLLILVATVVAYLLVFR